MLRRGHGIAVTVAAAGAVTESTWRDAVAGDSNFAVSETVFQIGRVAAAPAAAPDLTARVGRALAPWNLVRDYGFQDVDGRQPDWDGRARDELGFDTGCSAIPRPETV